MMKKAFLIVGTGTLLFAGFLMAEAKPFSQQNPLDKSKKTVTELKQANPFSMDEKYYVVIGVFEDVTKAIQYTDQVYERGIHTKFGWDPASKKAYVYVTATEDLEEARRVRNRLRRKKGFSKTWILNYMPTENKAKKTELTPSEMQEKPLSKNIKEESATYLTTANKTTGTLSEGISDSDTNSSLTDKPEEGIEETPEQKNTPTQLIKLYFDSFNAQNLESVIANIEVADPKSNKLVQLANAHDLYNFDKDKFTGDTALLICEAFGYRKMQHIIDLNKLSTISDNDFVIPQGDSTIINFELQRPLPGDIMVMYNVYFHNDAAVMKPTSRYELSKLLKMMQENKNYKIKIHGHTNGNGFGKIISPAKGSEELFRLTSETNTSIGGAKALSKARAATIKRYLELEGIEASRMEIKGWGGKHMLYDSKSPEAKKNMRVEIEIIEN